MLSISRLFARSPYIETERLIIRKMKRSDADDMFEYAKREDVTKYLLWAPHDNVAYTKSYLKQVNDLYKKGEFYDFGVELKSEKKFIGTCGFADLDMPNFCGEIGYVINPEYKGNGYASEAARAVIRYGFEVMGLQRIEARYMLGNDVSRHVMEKCGMSFEGILRKKMFIKDGNCDIGYCSILKDEFVLRNTDRQKFTNI